MVVAGKDSDTRPGAVGRVNCPGGVVVGRGTLTLRKVRPSALFVVVDDENGLGRWK